MSPSITTTTNSSCSGRSTWFRIPPYLHRASIPLLIGLTVLQLHSSPEHGSLLLAGWFFGIAFLGIVLEKSLAGPISPSTSALHARRATSNNNNNTTSTTTTPLPNSYRAQPKLLLALSLSRATLYVFIGDAAAAQLLSLNDTSRSEEGNNVPLVLTGANGVQLALAGSMWLLGALLWVIEPTIYWMSVWRMRSTGGDHEHADASWRKTVDVEGGYTKLDQEDSDVEEV